VRFGCTRRASCVDSKPKKKKPKTNTTAGGANDIVKAKSSGEDPRATGGLISNLPRQLANFEKEKEAKEEKQKQKNNYAPPSMLVPAELGALAVWIQNQNKNVHSQNKTQYYDNIHIIIRIQIITKPTSTANIQVRHFKTAFHILNTLPTYKYFTSKQHPCVHGPLRECLRARRVRAFLLLHITCVRSWCNWRASCVVAKH